MVITQGNNVVSLDALTDQYGEFAPDPSAHRFVEEALGMIDLGRMLSRLRQRQQLIVLLKMTGFETSREIAGIIGASVSLVDLEMKHIRTKLTESA